MIRSIFVFTTAFITLCLLSPFLSMADHLFLEKLTSEPSPFEIKTLFSGAAEDQVELSYITG